VEALTRVPETGSVLTVSPSAVQGLTPVPVVLRNAAAASVSWQADANSDWLQVSPREGRLGSRGRVELHLAVTESAPEGDVRGAVRVTSHDGSVAIVRLVATVERPPDLAAAADGCDVTATVEDEGEVRSVELRWLERSTTRIEPMVLDAAQWRARLPAVTTATRWWVTAVDARGNVARTTDVVSPAGACT
jgi:hypothetical protein